MLGHAASRKRSRSPVAARLCGGPSCQAAWCTAEKSSAAARRRSRAATRCPARRSRIPTTACARSRTGRPGRSAPSLPRRRPHPPPRPRPRPGPGSRPPWRPGTGGRCRRWPRGSGRPAAGHRAVTQPGVRLDQPGPPPRAVPAAGPDPRRGAGDSETTTCPRSPRASRGDHGEDEVGRPVSHPGHSRHVLGPSKQGRRVGVLSSGGDSMANVSWATPGSPGSPDIDLSSRLAGQRVRLTWSPTRASPPAANDRPRASDPSAPWLRATGSAAVVCQQRGLPPHMLGSSSQRAQSSQWGVAGRPGATARTPAAPAPDHAPTSSRRPAKTCRSGQVGGQHRLLRIQLVGPRDRPSRRLPVPSWSSRR